MQIHRGTPLKEIANAGEAARQLLARSGLDFCCQGERSLGDACKQAGLDAAALEETLLTLPPPEGRDWAHEGVSAIVDHVLGDCHPETERRLADVEAVAKGLSGVAAHELREAVGVLVALTRSQMQEEESHYFVRVRALADARKGRGPFPLPPFRTIHEHEQELRAGHARIYELLTHARDLGKALRGHGAADVQRAIDALGEALIEQLHLENNVLLPLARDLEPNGRPAVRS
jgi:regulator of cell morphogenesis and NO signaling